MTLGFIGFGEAAYHITRGLRAAGHAPVMAWDIHANTPGRGEKIRARAEETGTGLTNSSQGLAAGCDWIISAVTANQALAAVAAIAPYLTPRHLYADVNSVSPGRKQELDAAVRAAGARFVEVAIMAPVPPSLHKVPMLAGGEAAHEFQGCLQPFGMNIEVVGDKIGVAAATKMCRSIMIKGMEALVTECVLGATRYGAAERVFASLDETFPGIDWSKLASYMVGRVVVHGERRAREMEEVAATLREAGVNPMMAEATIRRMDWSVELGLKEHFHGENPATYEEFAGAVRQLVTHPVPARPTTERWSSRERTESGTADSPDGLKTPLPSAG